MVQYFSKGDMNDDGGNVRGGHELPGCGLGVSGEHTQLYIKSWGTLPFSGKQGGICFIICENLMEYVKKKQVMD